MTRKEWLRSCTDRLYRLGGMSYPGAIACAEYCAVIETLSAGDDVEIWGDPLVAADAEIASWDAQ